MLGHDRDDDHGKEPYSVTHAHTQAGPRGRSAAPDVAGGADRRRPVTLAALWLGAGLAGCTGSDPGIAFGPNGPVPSVDIASVSTSGAPVGAGAALRQAAASAPSMAPNPQYGDQPQDGASAPVESVQRGRSLALPPVEDSPPSRQAPPPRRMAALPPTAGPAENVDRAPPNSGGARSPTRSTASGAQVQFLPLIGVPQAKAELLARALSNSARTSGVTIRPAASTKTDLRLKGYFSAFNDGEKTTLVYVWDVLDANDQRTHRIQGQETVPGKADDPWAVVDSKVLDAVAQKTLSEAASYG